MTAAVVLHADGTACSHDGRPALDGQTWRCPAGSQVTHVVTGGGRPVEIGAAIRSLIAVAETFTAALIPLNDAFASWARFARQISDPRLRVLAAALAELQAAQAAEEAPAGQGEEPGQLPGQLPLPLPGTACYQAPIGVRVHGPGCTCP